MSEVCAEFDYNSEEISKAVSDEMLEEKVEEIDVKPATSTTSFKMVVGSVLAGIFVSVMAAKGIVFPDYVNNNLPLVFVLGVSYVTGKYIEGRSAVSVIKTQAEMQLKLRQQ